MAQAQARTGLKEYADGKRRIPLEEIINNDSKLLAEIDAGYRSGIGAELIAKWLKDEHGIMQATRSRVESYINRKGLTRDG